MTVGGAAAIIICMVQPTLAGSALSRPINKLGSDAITLENCGSSIIDAQYQLRFIIPGSPQLPTPSVQQAQAALYQAKQNDDNLRSAYYKAANDLLGAWPNRAINDPRNPVTFTANRDIACVTSSQPYNYFVISYPTWFYDGVLIPIFKKLSTCTSPDTVIQDFIAQYVPLALTKYQNWLNDTAFNQAQNAFDKANVRQGNYTTALKAYNDAQAQYNKDKQYFQSQCAFFYANGMAAFPSPQSPHPVP
jgi:hypothetical protein